MDIAFNKKRKAEDAEEDNAIPKRIKSVMANVNQSVKDQIEVVFLEIDKLENGLITNAEFRGFVEKLGVNMREDEFEELFNVIDTCHDQKIDFEEFFTYTYNLLHKSDTLDHVDGEVRVESKIKPSKRKAMLFGIARKLKHSPHQIYGVSVKHLLERNVHLKEHSNSQTFEEKLIEKFYSVESEELSHFIAERWKSYINFNRKGIDGCTVLTGDENIADALPGNYDLIELVMTQYKDINDMKVPRHAVIKSAKWETANLGSKEGRLLCTEEWNDVIPVDIGTNQLLSYYGACLATDKEERVALLQRHGTLDFTYQRSYHDEYVMKTQGGNGFERHAFHHMDCPLDDDSGFFILGKFVGNDLHLTAFKIPINHVLYVPPNTIHSNDHLLGRWRTMLSDAKDAPIDHVIITKQLANCKTICTNISFDYSVAHFHQGLETGFCTKCPDAKSKIVNNDSNNNNNNNNNNKRLFTRKMRKRKATYN